MEQVKRSCLQETWLVLGPDLVGWKLTEARLWAMLRAEEALQAGDGAWAGSVGLGLLASAACSDAEGEHEMWPLVTRCGR